MPEVTTNQRVARNTVILYIRMLFNLLVGVWTSRIVLNALGFVDNGLYNVVGGFVGFFYIVTNSQSSAISRFINFEVGKNTQQGLDNIFQASLFMQVFISLVILILSETVGIWFVNHRLVIPEDRIVAVNIVYQFSIISFILGLLSVPQKAVIIAHENMNIFAYISIAGSIAKLIISFIIEYAHDNRLILYAALLCFVNIATFFVYYIYIKRHFSACRYKLKFNKTFAKKLYGFAGWSFIGESSAVLRTSGISILLNLFGGPIANTINGITSQFTYLVSIFVNDFTTAFNPQITKQYASGEYESLIPFLYRCSKFSFLLITLMAVPVIFNVKFILVLWLKDVPELTNIFIIIAIIFTLVECLSKPLITAKAATGNIRNYQIIVGGILILTLPIAYVFLKIGFPIYYSYVAILITSIMAFFSRMVMLKGAIPLWSSMKFIIKVVIPMIITFIIAATLPFILKFYLFIEKWPLLIGSFLWTFGIISILGCDKTERQFIIKIVTTSLHIRRTK